MIINFSVQNFRSIKDKVTLSFEATNDDTLKEYYIAEPKKGLRILKMAIIYGPNASGKTNILKALEFLRNMVIKPFATKDQEFDYEPFLFDPETPNQPTEFELEFFHEGIKFTYYVQFTKQAVLQESLKYGRAYVYKRTTDIEQQFTQIVFGNKFKREYKPKKHEITALEINTLWNNTVLGGFLKTNLDLSLLQQVIEWFKERLVILFQDTIQLNVFLNLLFEKKFDEKEVIEMLKLADFGIKNITIKKDRHRINSIGEEFLLKEIISHINNKELPIDKETNELILSRVKFLHATKNGDFFLSLEDESHGTQRYFYYANLLLETLKKNKILAIDELESSLHPELVEHFLVMFLNNAQNAQLIFTTHLRDLLMNKEILRNDAIWFTERKEDQSTDLYSLADFDTSVIRKTNSIYNFYKAGRLGAVPNLGSYYLNLDHGKERGE